jgi:protein TonB
LTASGSDVTGPVTVSHTTGAGSVEAPGVADADIDVRLASTGKTASLAAAPEPAVVEKTLVASQAPPVEAGEATAFDAGQALALETPLPPDPETLMASFPAPSKPALSLRDMDPDTRFALLRGGEAPDEEEMTIVPSVMVAPDYPFEARRTDMEGFVKLAFSVDPEGRVSEIEVLDALPRRVFDRAATRALRQWRFEVDERLTENLRMVQTFDFRLEDAHQLSVAERRYCRGSVTRSHCTGRTRTLGVAYVSPPRRMRSR